MIVDFTGGDSSEIIALIARATAGERDAAAALIDAIAPILRARIARVVARRRNRRATAHELDDLVQQTLAALFDGGGRALRAWNPERGLGFLGFVGLLAEREVGMTLRTRKRNPWTEEPMAHDSLSNLGGATATLAVRIEARDQLRHLLVRIRRRLTGPGRRYFELLVVEERSVRAVAAQTGATADALYAWRARFGKLLREIQRELEPADGEPARPRSTPNRHAA